MHTWMDYDKDYLTFSFLLRVEEGIFSAITSVNLDSHLIHFFPASSYSIPESIRTHLADISYASAWSCGLSIVSSQIFTYSTKESESMSPFTVFTPLVSL